ncbi:CopD family protein [Hyphomonas sp.]|uniref:CopD family protein n=1 Tax=Hyphomonas sp. TaxID=87 RepID=UPI001BCD27DB
MDIYNWLKAGHIIFVVALMAGLLVFPRYKIHQLSSQPGEPLFETMKKSSGQLRMIILNPSLVLVWLFGLGMVYDDWQRGGSFIWKDGFTRNFFWSSSFQGCTDTSSDSATRSTA